MKNKSTLLELLRFIASMVVVLSHLGLLGGRFGIPHFYYVTAGGMSVTFFIILSGMVLTLAYRDRPLSWVKFFKNRILRIYPTYLITFFLAVIVFVLRKQVNLFDYWPDLLCGVVGMCAFFGLWGGAFLNTGWFIGLIIVLYATYPFLINLFRRNPYLTLIVLFIVSLLSRYITGIYETSEHSRLLTARITDWFVMGRLFEFGLGIYLAIFIPHKYLFILNKDDIFNKIILYLGDFSFIVYLVHMPWLFLAGQSIIAYFILIFVLSELIRRLLKLLH